VALVHSKASMFHFNFSASYSRVLTRILVNWLYWDHYCCVFLESRLKTLPVSLAVPHAGNITPYSFLLLIKRMEMKLLVRSVVIFDHLGYLVTSTLVLSSILMLVWAWAKVKKNKMKAKMEKFDFQCPFWRKKLTYRSVTNFFKRSLKYYKIYE
jgi:hypothetical protein